MSVLVNTAQTYGNACVAGLTLRKLTSHARHKKKLYKSHKTTYFSCLSTIFDDANNFVPEWHVSCKEFSSVWTAALRRTVKILVKHHLTSSRRIEDFENQSVNVFFYKLQLVYKRAPLFEFAQKSWRRSPDLHQDQGSRLTFHLSGQVASETFDFTSQNKFSLARIFLHHRSHTVFSMSIFSRVKYCKHVSVISRVKNWNIYYSFQRLKILTRIQSIMCIQGKFRHRARAEKRWEDKTNILRTL